MRKQKNPYIKISSFQTADFIHCGSEFDSTDKKVLNSCEYVMEDLFADGEESTIFPNALYFGNITKDGMLQQHDKNPFTGDYLLDIVDDGVPYLFFQRLDVKIYHEYLSSRKGDIRVVEFVPTEINTYDPAVPVYILDRVNGVDRWQHVSNIDQNAWSKDKYFCTFINKDVIMFKDYCNLQEWDDAMQDLYHDDEIYQVYSYYLYNIHTHTGITFLAEWAAIDVSDYNNLMSNDKDTSFHVFEVDDDGRTSLKNIKLNLLTLDATYNEKPYKFTGHH